jgi:lysozyme
MLRLSLGALLLSSLLSSFAFAESNSIVNLSHYDEMRPDFAMMRREGIVAAIHEATYPAREIDTAYATRQNQAKQAGLLWGAYHFADGSNPTRQADHFLDVVSSGWRASDNGGDSAGVLLVLDFEKNGHYPGGTMDVDQAVEFVERVHQRTGRYPGIYASELRIAAVLNHSSVNASTKSVLTKCWLWLANYHYQPRLTAPWSNWAMWQYTGDGVCELPRMAFPRAIANIRLAERNIFRGSSGAVRSFWEKNAWNPAGR